MSTSCLRCRLELNQEQQRRLEKQNDSKEKCSIKDTFHFFAHFSPENQQWLCSDCSRPIAQHSSLQEKASGSLRKDDDKIQMKNNNTNTSVVLASLFQKDQIVFNKATKAFAQIESMSLHPTSGNSTITVLPLMSETPSWKPKNERKPELCDAACLTPPENFTKEQQEKLEQVLNDEQVALERLQKGDGHRVCPQPPCGNCGHRFCHQTVGEDPSDLGGWSIVCMSSNPCECKFCVEKNATRRPIDGENGCCGCEMKKRFQ